MIGGLLASLVYFTTIEGINSYIVFGLILLLLSMLLIVKSLGKKINYLLFAVLTVLVIYSGIAKGYDKTFTAPTQIEISQVSNRSAYFGWNLGKLYKNRIGIYYFDNFRPFLVKYNRNMFAHLDLNKFFNINSLLSIAFIPVFIVGFWKFARNLSGPAVIYFLVVFFAGGLIYRSEPIGWYMYIPLINLVLFLGIAKLVKWLT